MLRCVRSQLKDVESAAMGYGCEDEEECMLDYDDDDDDEEANESST